MDFKLIDRDWRANLLAAANGAKTLRVICPFIKRPVIEAILEATCAGTIEVITRLNAADFFQNVSDVSALRLLLDRRAKVKVVKNLHAKLYLFDGKRAVLTSANLTDAALDRNHEFGAFSEESAVVAGCTDYFDAQWAAAGPELTRAKLAKCESAVDTAKATGARNVPPDLEDFGHVSPLIPVWGDELLQDGVRKLELQAFHSPPSSFVKFFGDGNHRSALTVPIIEEIKNSGSHWACTSSQPHRQPVDGSVMFLSRMVRPRDYRIYGVALAQPYDPNRDVARPADILQRPWKKQWPYYIRVHGAVFIAGTLANGISLHALMDALEHEAFESTTRNFHEGLGKTTNPRETLRQAHSRELSSKANEWILMRFQELLKKHGRVPEADLADLDWPSFEDS